MNPEEAITTALERIDGLSAHVFPMEGLKNARAPFVFYLRRQHQAEDSLEGPTELQTADFGVHCVAKTYASLIWLSGMARSALLGLQGQTLDGLTIEHVTVQQASPDLKEREADLYRRAFALRMNYQEEVTHE